jgi:cellobiose phosphorylase
MNSGMAAKTFHSLARIARQRGDTAFALKAETWRDSLRAAVGRAFDEEWFVGCYTDDGQLICGHNDRLYLNAQSWAALGGCGTPGQRRKALLSAARECSSSIGLMLMSKAYSSPAPPEVSWCPIPRGEGENGGIWPQTIHWTVWAMANEGLLDEALAEWKKGTLHTHAHTFPEVPYGIYNGPDCWSSRLAGRDEGWTQYNLFNRAMPCPMSPMISWQAFALLMIHQAHTAKT